MISFKELAYVIVTTGAGSCVKFIGKLVPRTQAGFLLQQGSSLPSSKNLSLVLKAFNELNEIQSHFGSQLSLPKILLFIRINLMKHEQLD